MRLKGCTIILASGSPRRRQLMAAMGLEFTVAEKFGADETYPPTLAPRRVPQFLARVKSDAYPAPLAEGEILVTADTVVILDGAILGKPRGRDEAIAMLTMLSGRGHTVVTGVCLRSARRRKTFAATTKVAFRELTRTEIEHYVDTCRPFDKAGAYGIQEWIGSVGVRSIRGSYNNVVGLPTEALWIELSRWEQAEASGGRERMLMSCSPPHGGASGCGVLRTPKIKK